MSNSKKGKLNNIADVAGISVGHVTLANGDVQTGVTAIMPHQDNMFKHKCVAACEVINGFGKSVGLVQIEELGQLETPIILTNTLSVGTASGGLVKYMLNQTVDIAHIATSVNPVVLECNDAYLNDIRAQNVAVDDVLKALNNTSQIFSQGAVGAGRGMSAYKLKGGIGSASRIIEYKNKAYTIGALVLTNMGRLEDFTHYNKKLSANTQNIVQAENSKDNGSIIMVLATDLPLDARQLKRLCKRGGVGLARTGSHFGHGSGDIVLSFSTHNQINYKISELETIQRFPEADIDLAFDGAIEAVEEAIINSMLKAETVTGFNGRQRLSLKDVL